MFSIYWMTGYKQSDSSLNADLIIDKIIISFSDLKMDIPYVSNLMSVLTATNIISGVLRQKAVENMNEGEPVTTNIVPTWIYDLGSVIHFEQQAGSAILFPTNLSSSYPADSVRLVLWFKDSATKPIYSLDARGIYI